MFLWLPVGFVRLLDFGHFSGDLQAMASVASARLNLSVPCVLDRLRFICVDPFLLVQLSLFDFEVLDLVDVEVVVDSARLVALIRKVSELVVLVELLHIIAVVALSYYLRLHHSAFELQLPQLLVLLVQIRHMLLLFVIRFFASKVFEHVGTVHVNSAG